MKQTSDNYVLIWQSCGRICAETFLVEHESGRMLEKIAELITGKPLCVGWLEVHRFGLKGESEKILEWDRADTDQ